MRNFHACRYWSCLPMLLLWVQLYAQDFVCPDPRTDRTVSLLVYVFTPDRQIQDRRARTLEWLSRQSAWHGHIAAFRRADTSSGSKGIRRDGTSETLCSAEGVVLRAIPEEYLSADAEDYLALMDCQGVVSLDGTGAFFDLFLDEVLVMPISTDIDESTWGKIKVLFK